MCADRETIEQLMKTFSMIFRCVFQRIANTLDVAESKLFKKAIYVNWFVYFCGQARTLETDK